MIYSNPVVSGFYPDPSVCRAGDKFYMVTSSFQFFPGVPLFESADLVNWTQIGHVLTRESQLPLEGAGSTGGIYAPTIRYNDGRFYMVTTNVTNGGNFYVYTDDIHGEWSDPIYVAQGGIDPSLYFENGKAYFMSNGEDDEGRHGITQCEINVENGEKLTPSKMIWAGAGGRFLESPHLYKIGKSYYLMASEGGTEYGHMIVYAKGDTPYGPFEGYKNNPVLTNRNLGGYQIQGCGHGDLVEDENGNFWCLHLGFRQIHQWVMHHTTGREVYLVPVKFDSKGWFTMGDNGTTKAQFNTDLIPDTVKQEHWSEFTFENTKVGREWCFMQNPDMSLYELSDKAFSLRPNDHTIFEADGSPAFVCIRQKEMNETVQCDLTITEGEAGLVFYMTPDQHYEIGLRKTVEGTELFRRLCIGDIRHEDHITKLPEGESATKLICKAANFTYAFSAELDGKAIDMGGAQAKFLSTEVAGNFTGVVIGLYAHKVEGKGGKATFTNFSCKNDEIYE
ncbi:glycoside hydrolase family 43 protein [Ruminococcus sp.]|uniref:glycoside hydrolase family 43 protein n=1 Tax=Ruminococcus sp. TaxID=41978 RepID=UPI0025D63C25|nr:glycoside hydrolase family 43 protein [Ruminococcus sp.]